MPLTETENAPITDEAVDQGAELLSKYLSALLRANIVVPPDLIFDGDVSDDSNITGFLHLLPEISQEAPETTEDIVFLLPMVFPGRGTTLAAPVAMTLNALLNEAARDGADEGAIRIPTFFYPDGSTMVLIVDLDNLGKAIRVVATDLSVQTFVTMAIAKLKEHQEQEQNDRHWQQDQRGGGRR